MLKMKQGEIFKVQLDYLGNEVILRMVEELTIELTRMFTDYRRPAVDWTERCGAKKTGSSKKQP